MTETITGAQLAARALIDRKIEHIFSLSGGHITPIYQYLEGIFKYSSNKCKL